MRMFVYAALVACGLMAVGCAASTDAVAEDEGSTEQDAVGADFEAGTWVRRMPVRSSSFAPKAALAVTPPAGTALTYYGGPVLSHVKVVAVYWGADVAMQARLNDFYSAITNSEHFDWLSEYNTPTQTIGRGTFAGAVVINPSISSVTLTDKQIQKELSKQLTAHKLPANDPDTLYMVHFPPGVSISQGGYRSCTQNGFCGYHGTFKKSSKMVYYGVIPDQGGGCMTGCGPSPISDGLTVVTSHELIEAVTDPGIGLAKTEGPPLGWYNTTSGEIGDICAGPGDSTTIAGYAVQLEWSNARNACVAK